MHAVVPKTHILKTPNPDWLMLKFADNLDLIGIQACLDMGANINCPALEYNGTALPCVAFALLTHSNKEATKLLKELLLKGLDVAGPIENNGLSYTAFDLICSQGFSASFLWARLKLVLNAGATPSHVSPDLTPPILLLAGGVNQADNVKRMVKAGANINATDNTGKGMTHYLMANVEARYQRAIKYAWITDPIGYSISHFKPMANLVFPLVGDQVDAAGKSASSINPVLWKALNT